MGEVEQYRMNMPGETRILVEFVPNVDVERALVRDVQTATNNLLAYLTRCKAYGYS